MKLSALRACHGKLLPFKARSTKFRSRISDNLLEPISKSSEEHNEAGELDEAEEVLGVILPADENAALPLDPREEALDQPASHVAA
jgi:hypothetical protein